MAEVKDQEQRKQSVWIYPFCLTVLSTLCSLVWFAASQNGKLERVLEQQTEAKQQQVARDQRDETYRAAQATAIAEIKINDSRQDLRIESLEKWRAQNQPQSLGRWTR